MIHSNEADNPDLKEWLKDVPEDKKEIVARMIIDEKRYVDE